MQHKRVKVDCVGEKIEEARALIYRARGVAAVEPVALPALGRGMIEVATSHSGLSRGTERLVFHGRVPEAEWQRMRAPHQVGDFPFPVRYGYAAVGRVTAPADSSLIGRDVFCLHPHQTRFRVAADAVVPIPAPVSPSRAVLAANMETALNALWDAPLRPGARVLVVGMGMVGALLVALLGKRPDMSVTVTDVRPDSAAPLFDKFVKIASPGDVPARAFDLAFHSSASAGGLATALDALDFEGTLVELSWYGDRPVEVALGDNFHANRLRIVSSQVGHVAPVRRATTSRRDRLALALAALDDPLLDRLITEEVAFERLPERLPVLLGPSAPGVGVRIVYQAAP